MRPKPQFLEVELVESEHEPEPIVVASPKIGSVYRIGLGGVLSVEVTDNFREDTLRRLIGVVSSC